MADTPEKPRRAAVIQAVLAFLAALAGAFLGVEAQPAAQAPDVHKSSGSN